VLRAASDSRLEYPIYSLFNDVTSSAEIIYRTEWLWRRWSWLISKYYLEFLLEECKNWEQLQILWATFEPKTTLERYHDADPLGWRSHGCTGAHNISISKDSIFIGIVASIFVSTCFEYARIIQKFPDWVITKYTLTSINTRWEVTQRVMEAKLTKVTHKIAIQLHLVVQSCTICSSRSRRPVRKLLDTPSYGNSAYRWSYSSLFSSVFL
jgi:hypothetical protein